jgi:3-oxoacyl-[acyl-carrier protein] reductase
MVLHGMSKAMMFTLEGKRALVCGSTQGIGKACAMEFARLGALVTLAARHPEALEKVCSELPADHGQKHSYVRVDFSDYKAVRTRAAEHVAADGPVHILLNNTGGPPAGPAFEAQPEEYLAAITQHVLCNQVLVQTTAPGMRDAQYGRIINIISTSVIMPIKNLGVSNTTRAAVANWARTLAAELGPFGITVNNVLPGYTHTTRLDTLIAGRAARSGTSAADIQRDMIATIPARRFGRAEEIAAVAAFLASPAASYVNGASIPVDGGRLAAQ